MNFDLEVRTGSKRPLDRRFRLRSTISRTGCRYRRSPWPSARRRMRVRRLRCWNWQLRDRPEWQRRSSTAIYRPWWCANTSACD